MIRVTLEGESWTEIVKQAEALATLAKLVPPAAAQPAVMGNPAPVALPFDKGAALIPPPTEYVCQEHGARLNHKPAGTNRQGTPYAEGYRCPVSGCRTFVPMTGAAA